MKKLITLVTLIVVVIFGATTFAAHEAVENSSEIAALEAELALIKAEGETEAEVIIDGDNLKFMMGLDKEEAENHNLYDGEFVYISHECSAFSCYAVLHFDDNNLLTYNTLLSLESDIRVEKSGIYTTFTTIAAAIMLASITVLGLFMESILDFIESKDKKEIAKKEAEAREAARRTREEAEKAEAEAIIAEAVETLANIKDNGLVVFGKFSLEFSLERCCNYVSRDNINNLKEALDNLVYRC